MDVIIPTGVLKALSKARPADRERVLAAIQQVAEAHPQRLSFVTEMVGEGAVWRLRKGDWRVVYTIDDHRLVVRAIDQRKEIYR